jgi:hypothetical protein
MKQLIFSLLAFLLLAGVSYGQEDKEIEIKQEKKIIVQTIDEDGNVITEEIEGDKAFPGDVKVWVTEEGDSIRVELEMEEDGDTKKIRKKIIIGDLKDLGEIEGLEDLDDIEKNIRIYSFDDKAGPLPHHRFWMNEYDSPHFPGQNHFYFFNEDEPGQARLGVVIEDAEGGVKVKEVRENSSAWSLGILAGDVITHIDGKKMTNVEELQRAVTDHNPGDMIDIKLKRNGKTEKFSARLQSSGSAMSFRMPQEFHDGMRRFKHHFYRGIDEWENHPRWKEFGDPGCDDTQKMERKRDRITDKEIQLEKKVKQMEEKMKQKEFEMQQKEKEILEREIEKNEQEEENE